jgi:hypothetical protein
LFLYHQRLSGRHLFDARIYFNVGPRNGRRELEIFRWHVSDLVNSARLALFSGKRPSTVRPQYPELILFFFFHATNQIPLEVTDLLWIHLSVSCVCLFGTVPRNRLPLQLVTPLLPHAKLNTQEYAPIRSRYSLLLPGNTLVPFLHPPNMTTRTTQNTR